MEKPSKLWLVPFVFVVAGLFLGMSADYYGEIGDTAMETACFIKAAISLGLGSISIKLLGL